MGDHVRLREKPRVHGGVLTSGVVGVVLGDDGVSKEPFRVGHLNVDRGESCHEHSYYHVNDLLVVDDETPAPR